MNALDELIQRMQQSQDPYWKAKAIEADMEINNLIFRADQKADMQERDVWSHLYAELSGNEYGGAYSLGELNRVIKQAAAELAALRARVEQAEGERKQVKDFLEGLIHGPCAGVSYQDFVKYCEREARQLAAALGEEGK